MIRVLSIVCLLFLSVITLMGQTDISTLEKKKAQLQDEINFTRSKIKEIRSLRSNSLNELQTLKKQIEIRQELIGNIRSQVKLLDADMADRKEYIDVLEKDIAKLKKGYADMVRHAYMHYNRNANLLYVFSSNSFNQAYKRVQYLRKYNEFRIRQAEIIKSTQESLKEEVAELEKSKQAKLALLENEEEQRLALSDERKEVDGQIQAFRSEESKHEKAIKEKERAAQQLNKQIEILIAEARRKAREEAERKAKAAGTTTTASSGTAASNALELTPEARALSNSFTANRGKLPWPVTKGTIIGNFGKRPHPIYEKIIEENKGVDIAAETDASVKAIFNGTVQTSFYSPVFQWGVIIMHGEYFTVYTGLKDVSVTANQEVKTGQSIGSVYTDNSNARTVVHLEVWKGEAVQNPALWLAR